jgi:chloramphenicol 3-O-phosphotransferase
MTTAAIYIVTGAPGAGKSTTLAAFLRLNSGYIAFDMDWLATPASHLADKDIRFEQATWQPYNALWFEILRAIQLNHTVPVLFAPLDERDIRAHEAPVWWTAIHWCLLDCSDTIRRQRLTQRHGWTAAMVEDAISDAHFLRTTIRHRIDTGTSAPDEVARRIAQWVQCTRGTA